MQCHLLMIITVENVTIQILLEHRNFFSIVEFNLINNLKTVIKLIPVVIQDKMLNLICIVMYFFSATRWQHCQISSQNLKPYTQKTRFRGFPRFCTSISLVQNQNSRKKYILTLVANGGKKSYMTWYQFIIFQAVFGHLAKVHKYKILAGELIWKFGIMWKKLG